MVDHRTYLINAFGYKRRLRGVEDVQHDHPAVAGVPVGYKGKSAAASVRSDQRDEGESKT